MLGNWNRIVVEISQGQPFELGDGFAAARVWVNENVTPRVGFGDFAAGKYPVTDGNNAALDICGPFDPTTPNKVSQTWLGYYDVLNFVWIEGAQNLFQDTSSKFHSERLKSISIAQMQIVFSQHFPSCLTHKLSSIGT